jgi:hypothetical protein
MTRTAKCDRCCRGDGDDDDDVRAPGDDDGDDDVRAATCAAEVTTRTRTANGRA